MGWSGSFSNVYTGLKNKLLAIKDKENNINVIQWLNELLEDITLTNKQLKIREEERGF